MNYLLLSLSIVFGIVLFALICLVVVLMNRILTLSNESKATGKLIDKSNIGDSISIKYAHSRLSEPDKVYYSQRVVEYLRKDKPYRKSNLTISKLAKELDMPKYYLSQVINEEIGCGFLEFINQYRVKEAIQRIKDGEVEVSLMDIAKEVGFNSKSSFYAAFKKYTNKSPGAFKRSMQKAQKQ